MKKIEWDGLEEFNKKGRSIYYYRDTDNEIKVGGFVK
jgi:hypothetical protein